MTLAVCPYCRGPIDPSAGEQFVCPGCGTPHHGDCYAENGGCTVFGCGAAPPEEPKLRLSGSELSSTTPAGEAPVASPIGVEGQSGSLVPRAPVKAPPPPPPPGSAPAQQEFIPQYGVGSVLFSAQPVPVVAVAHAPAEFDFELDPAAKNRMTFIVLGVLLGAFGAHNFYAGYRGKGAAQLCLSVLTLGLGSPMSWVWAVIDVWTIDRDGRGIKFRS